MCVSSKKLSRSVNCKFVKETISVTNTNLTRALNGVPEAAREVGRREEHAPVPVQDDGLQPPLDAGRDVVGPGRGGGQPHHLDRGGGGSRGDSRVGGGGVRLAGMTGQLFGGGHPRRYCAVRQQKWLKRELEMFCTFVYSMLASRVRGGKFKLALFKSM